MATKSAAIEKFLRQLDSTDLLIKFNWDEWLAIEAPYADLVRMNSRFWNAGGFSFKIGLMGAEFKNTSLESLVSGGVAFATPQGEKGELAPPAPEGAVFQIATEPEKEWLKF